MSGVRVFQFACACIGAAFSAAAGHWDAVIWAAVAAILVIEMSRLENKNG